MNKKELKELIKMFESSSLSRIKLDMGDVTIEMEKTINEPAETKTKPQSSAVKLTEHETPGGIKNNSHTAVKAPLVGTYYESPAPDQPPFVRSGQSVSRGDILCIIEAMKVMNEITAPKTGKVMAIHTKNGDMVMFDQVIMEID